jgi:phosphopantetheinyl transferase
MVTSFLDKNAVHLWYTWSEAGAIDRPTWLDLPDQPSATSPFASSERGRAFLRFVFNHYENLRHQSLVIQRTPSGKPFLLDLPEWHFNLTHTRNLIAVIIARGREVGVDAEYLARPLPSAEDLVLSHEEQSALAALAPEQAHQRFFLYWTMKEALGKALGGGLAEPLNQVNLHHQDSVWNIIATDEILQYRKWHVDTLLLPHHRLSWVMDLDVGENQASQVMIQEKYLTMMRVGW